MKKVTDSITTGTLNVVRRLKNSFYGNPRYAVVVGDLYLETIADAAYSYQVTNNDGKPVEITHRIRYGKPYVTTIKRA